MKKIGYMIGGTLGVLIGLGFVFPAVAQLRMEGALPTISVCLLLLGLSLVTAGGWSVLAGLKLRKI